MPTANRNSIFISGTGIHLPQQTVASSALEEKLGLPSGWAVSRSGVRERRIAAPEEATSDLAIEAAKEAINTAGLEPGDIGLLILATSTPDHPIPPTAPLVAHMVGCKRAAAFDLAAACSGFIYGLSTAEQYLLSGTYRHVLVVGANVMSRRLDWDDPQTCILFGDGAGATVLSTNPDRNLAGPRLLSTSMTSDGEGYTLLMAPAGGSRQPLTEELIACKSDKIKMKGPLLFRRAVRLMAKSLMEILERNGLGVSDLDWILPHQANHRIVSALGEELSVPADRFILNLERYGNTSAASIPIALHEFLSSSPIKPGQRMALVSFGSGLTAAAALLQW